MLEWMADLPNHIYGVREVEGSTSHGPLGNAKYTLGKTTVRQAEASEDEAKEDDSVTVKKQKVDDSWCTNTYICCPSLGSPDLQEGLETFV